VKHRSETRTAQAHPSGIPSPSGDGATSEPLKPAGDIAVGSLPPDPGPTADEAILDEFEALERATTLDGDEDDEPGAKEEVALIPVVGKLPKFARFRVNPDTIFDMWGVTDEAGMDRTVIVVTKEFAPVLEEEVELRKVRFYETVTADGVVRLVYNFLPENDEKTPNSWLASKAAVMERAKTTWVTMRSVKRLGQYTFRPASKDYDPPQFSGMSRGELIHHALRKAGLLVEDESHGFYRKAADLDDE
jgi:hypothetical protein